MNDGNVSHIVYCDWDISHSVHLFFGNTLHEKKTTKKKALRPKWLRQASKHHYLCDHWSGLLSGYCSWGLDDDLTNTLTRNWQYLNPDEHIFVPLQVPLRTLDLIEMWCRTSKTSSDTSFFLLKTAYSYWALKLSTQIRGQFSFKSRNETKIISNNNEL